ncbi:hypothetical protein AX279_17695 [Pseudomonas sp. J237]|nr:MULTISPECIES: hypothetical protein [Pseudomonas]OEO24502.1 hypothetical protein AX279_17695 [Pseudomonas sp. J237]CRN68844.1 hypothetical protein PAERUG_P40_Scotland_4_VIM_2_09_12_04168 [Pseudomonas aeruginosa]
MIDRKIAKQQILAAAREMAKAFPTQDYCYAREHFGLLRIIKRITGNIMPTARQCWEYVGLDRTAIVDEFEFAQTDIARAS